jgi:hypothetical protein
MAVEESGWSAWVFNPLAASLAGGALSAIYAFPGASIGIKLTNGMASFLVAIFAGSAIVEKLQVESIKVSAFLIFTTGIIGLIGVNGLLDWARKTPIANWPVLKIFFGRATPEQPK